MKSSLESRGRASEAILLDRAATGEAGAAPFMGHGPSDAILPAERGGNNRIWKDIAGNQLVAEFVGAQGAEVYLCAASVTKPFSVNAFIRIDQDWIEAQRGPGMEKRVAGGSASGMASGHDGYPPSMTPREPITTPPSDNGHPGGSMSGGHFAENPYGYGSLCSAMPSSSGYDSGISPVGLPRTPFFEWKYKCRHFGAEFTSSGGLRGGDPCPKYSPGASRRSSYKGSSSGSGGRFIGGSIAIFTLIMAFVGWIVRQVFS